MYYIANRNKPTSGYITEYKKVKSYCSYLFEAGFTTVLAVVVHVGVRGRAKWNLGWNVYCLAFAM